MLRAGGGGGVHVWQRQGRHRRQRGLRAHRSVATFPAGMHSLPMQSGICAWLQLTCAWRPSVLIGGMVPTPTAWECTPGTGVRD